MDAWASQIGHALPYPSWERNLIKVAEAIKGGYAIEAGWRPFGNKVVVLASGTHSPFAQKLPTPQAMENSRAFHEHESSCS